MRTEESAGERTAGAARGDDSGRHHRTLPWATSEEDGESPYLALPKAGPEESSECRSLLFLDPLEPEHPHGEGHFVVFRVPCVHLGISAEEARRLAGTEAPADSGVGALVSRFLNALIGEDGLCHSASARRLSLNAVDLVALLVAELLGPGSVASPAAGGEMLTRIRDHIETHLMDPDLSPQSIARAHHISVRYLHKLFQSDGTTVGTWIRQRRLESCRVDLGRPSNRRRTVAAVAQNWGFASPSHFSRLFRRTYGLSPTEWQISLSTRD
ncbi:helix-turn-helix transcriptional regulator [Streptomyces sp. VRA16 Mangrove soil]|uniref:helix-turn-helix transcriptional regulator n=1 Tax=Streptomyces sp. VRA16 Mangrove soil TaxID=2817434 RepID=UPI001A9D2614|nr:helix-turn-helix transcriptional regulator [Streptomyces sp. VRA16 Mangrove soil]MBO1331823.1 helix-turn-helix transcriptional regulator [Streptomyces sp. VRA16 Mangrove soil]